MEFENAGLWLGIITTISLIVLDFIEGKVKKKKENKKAQA